MRRLVIFTLVFALILSSVSFVYADGVLGTLGKGLDGVLTDVLNLVGKTLQELIQYTIGKFKDIKATDWFIDQVSKLVGSGGIDGYPDGTFKPTNTISRSEFTKILVSVLGHKDLPKTTNHWASGYISKAEEIGLIDKGEFKDMDKTITRNEMAKMCANSLDYLGESHVSDRDPYKGLIKDYTKIPDKYKDYVLKTYAKGIITGFPDGTFGGDKSLTRAEASAVIVRVIDKSERKVPEKPSMLTDFGPHVDLRKVPIIGEGEAEIGGPKGENNPHNLDFGYMFRTHKSMDEQYTDAENLLSARFGKDNATVKEVMNYIRSSNNLPEKKWTINGQLVRVNSNTSFRVINVQAWRAK